mmetsp:Transcript_24826/g.64056  ORF Transcript_24826/g.64056 Transcript_24826/m.64056 type:complete len:213 (-) Transcript_24826:128-766(-)
MLHTTCPNWRVFEHKAFERAPPRRRAQDAAEGLRRARVGEAPALAQLERAQPGAHVREHAAQRHDGGRAQRAAQPHRAQRRRSRASRERHCPAVERARAEASVLDGQVLQRRAAREQLAHGRRGRGAHDHAACVRPQRAELLGTAVRERGADGFELSIGRRCLSLGATVHVEHPRAARDEALDEVAHRRARREPAPLAPTGIQRPRPRCRTA